MVVPFPADQAQEGVKRKKDGGTRGVSTYLYLRLRPPHHHQCYDKLN